MRLDPLFPVVQFKKKHLSAARHRRLYAEDYPAFIRRFILLVSRPQGALQHSPSAQTLPKPRILARPSHDISSIVNRRVMSASYAAS